MDLKRNAAEGTLVATTDLIVDIALKIPITIDSVALPSNTTPNFSPLSPQHTYEAPIALQLIPPLPSTSSTDVKPDIKPVLAPNLNPTTLIPSGASPTLHNKRQKDLLHPLPSQKKPKVVKSEPVVEIYHVANNSIASGSTLASDLGSPPLATLRDCFGTMSPHFYFHSTSPHYRFSPPTQIHSPVASTSRLRPRTKKEI